MAKKIQGVNLIPEVTTRPRLEAFVRKHVFNAAGSNTQIQFNDAGSFAADPSLVWDVTHPNDGLGIFLDETDRGPKVHLDVNYGYLDELAADSGGGSSVTFGSGTTVAGKLYYLETSGVWTLVDANAPATGATQLLAIALGTDAADDGMLIHGFFNMDSYLGSFSKGVPVYVSTDAGQATLTAPAGAGDFTRVIGHCTEYSNVIYFNPNQVSGSGDSGGGGGISWDGSTANGVATYKNSSEATVEANLTFDGTDLGVSDKIFHIGDTDTFINFTTDDINIQAGGVNFIDLTSGSQHEITFNEAGVDVDFRAEGTGETHLLFVDASTDKVGIGTDAPDYKLHVAGNIGVNQYIYHNDDADTYIRFAPDLVNVVAGGFSAIKYEKSTGKIIINNTNENVDFHVMAEDNTELLTTDAANNRVGIGTTAPEAYLDIKNIVDDGTTNRTMLRLHNQRSDDADVNDFGPISIDFDIENLDAPAKSGLARITAVQCPIGTDHTTPSGEKSSGLIFSTMAGDTLAEAMRIDASGNVGIGTSSPTAKLGVNGSAHITGSILPGADDTHDLGSLSARWANIYTGDLHLANDRGDWTVVEEEDYLTIRNNRTGKRFKLLMEEID